MDFRRDLAAMLALCLMGCSGGPGVQPSIETRDAALVDAAPVGHGDAPTGVDGPAEPGSPGDIGVDADAHAPPRPSDAVAADGSTYEDSPGSDAGSTGALLDSAGPDAADPTDGDGALGADGDDTTALADTDSDSAGAVVVDAAPSDVQSNDGPDTAAPPGARLWSPCTADLDCGPDWVCNLGYGQDGAGLCTLLGALGTLCEDADDCLSDFSCTPTMVAPGTKECLPPLFVPTPCHTNADCGASLICNGGVDGPGSFPGTCLPVGGVGASCSEDADCASGGHCVPFWGSQGYCMPSGEPWVICTEASDCGAGHKCADLPFGILSQCVPGGVLKVDCETDAECPAGQVCVGEVQQAAIPSEFAVCRPPGPFGAPCEDDHDCAPPFQCAAVMGGICMVAQGTGTEPYWPVGCAPGLGAAPFFAPTGGLGDPEAVCRQTVPDGGGCVMVAECEYDSTCTSYNGKSECHATLLAECKSDSDCADGLTCQSSYGGFDDSCILEVNYGMICDGICSSSGFDGCTECWCQGGQDAYETFPAHCGQCLPAPASRGPGEPCGRAVDCASGLACLPFAGSMVCAPGKALDEPCVSNAECGSGLVCVTVAGQASCQPTRELWETCDEPTDCQPDLECRGPGPNLCRLPLTYTHCDPAVGCGPGMVCETALGGPGGLCHSWIWKIVEWTCKDWVGPSECGTCFQWCPNYEMVAEPFTCSQCVPEAGILIEGEACAEDAWCQDGLLCTSAGACHSPGLATEKCSNHHDCAQGLRCLSKACSAPAGVGQPCPADLHCAGGLTCRPVDDSHVCLEPAEPGEACDSNADCEEPWACIGTPGAAPTDGLTGTCGAGTLGVACTYPNDCGAGTLCLGTPKTCHEDTSGKGCWDESVCGSEFWCNTWCGWCELLP